MCTLLYFQLSGVSVSPMMQEADITPYNQSIYQGVSKFERCSSTDYQHIFMFESQCYLNLQLHCQLLYFIAMGYVQLLSIQKLQQSDEIIWEETSC